MKSKYRIAVIPGDGVGVEVIHEAIKILNKISRTRSVKLDILKIQGGGNYLQHVGKEWDEDSFEKCKTADAILLGSIGVPGVSLSSTGVGSKIIFGLRLGLDLYANVRPVRLYDGVRHKVNDRFQRVWDDVDFVIVRENTEGLYNPVKGMLSRNGLNELAIDTRIITRKGAERIIEYAFKLCEKRQKSNPKRKNLVTCVDKSNILSGCKLFREIFDEVGSRHPRMETDYSYIDSFAMNIVREPQKYDVIVTSNLMGDILSDLSSALQGGLGMAPSGNIGDRYAMFEPVHGSAPDIAGKNIANPIGAVLSCGMMLTWLGEKEKDKSLLKTANDIETAVAKVLKKDRYLTPDIGGNSTCSELGNAIADEIS